MNRITKTLSASGVIFFIALCACETASAAKVAQYAQIDYDVVYVRCPRGKEPVIHPATGELLSNPNGANDMWLSAANNIYQQPGCDLVLHHSDPTYGGGLAANSRAREEVLVDCDEENMNQPVCTVADPNVSFDGRYVVYSKFTDTRTFLEDLGTNSGGMVLQDHNQSFQRLYPNGDGPNGVFASFFRAGLKPFNAPAFIYRYDLQSGVETRVSPANEGLFGGRAHPDGGPTSNAPVMDTGPFFMPDGRIGFTSNRDSGTLQFQLFAMEADGTNLELLGHRALAQQLHPAILKDGRIVYTSFDRMLQKVWNNNYSLFTIEPDGANPFILAGKQDSTMMSYHFVTQLSDGDVVVALYYNKNNGGMGTLLRFPIDPPGPDFTHLNFRHEPASLDGWSMGNMLIPFGRKGEFILTPEASSADDPARPYDSSDNYWLHPSDGRTITMHGRFTHPAAAPDNNLLVTYTIGGSSVMPSSAYETSLPATLEVIGKDAGIWLLPLESNSQRQIGHIADDARLVVDFPEYHEIMPRPVVRYADIYSIPRPGMEDGQQDNEIVKPTPNYGTGDARLPAGAPYGLTGAATLFDSETQSLNGTPWNMSSGGVMAGRAYSNLASNGADLAIYNNEEIYGIRVALPITPYPNNYAGNAEQWAGIQTHHLRILGEFPVRKADGTPLDGQGNPDTSFVLRLPADTPFLFQTIDKRGMALNIETTSRTVARGEQQLCGGCHVHTRESLDPFQSLAKLDTAAPYGDFTVDSAPLFAGFDANGDPTVEAANKIYDESLAPGVNNRRSFAVDWENGIADIIERRCASCHGEGGSAQQLTGLRLDGDVRTYELLTQNKYTREDNVLIDANTKPGDGLVDVRNATPGTDRITPRHFCCTPSRWVSLNSARSSMLVWALYGERLDGRDPQTGLPYPGSGVPVDDRGYEHPEIWPKVNEHASYVSAMPEEEKRLIARWVDIGAPKLNAHDDMMRPVLTISPASAGNAVSTVLVGVWDDSALDYSRFKVTANGVDITPSINGTPDIIQVPLGTTVTETNADQVEFVFEIWDQPDRSLSLVQPGVTAANRTRKTLTGRALLRMAGTSVNRAPTSAEANIVTRPNQASQGVAPLVYDPDIGDTHTFVIISQPTHGSADVINNRLVYTPDADYLGSDSFRFRASDLGGLSVDGTATVEVTTAAPAPGGSSGSGSTATGGSGGVIDSGGGGAFGPLAALVLLVLMSMRRLSAGARKLEK